jgi:hypothetical protein
MTQKISMLKVLSIIGILMLLVFVLVTFCINNDKTKQIPDQLLTGRYSTIDSPAIVLNLLPGHAFTLENNVLDIFNGDGNWELTHDERMRLSLDFENGEHLTLTYTPGDSSFVIESTPETITLYKTKK